MERFTKRDAFGFHVNGVDFGDGSYLLAGQGFKTTQARGRAVDRLAAYEDTGLTPEEIERLRTALSNTADQRDVAIDERREFEADNARLTTEMDALRERSAAAERDMVLAVGGRRCEICANDQCHYSDDEDIVACSASMFKWRGPDAGQEGVKK